MEKAEIIGGVAISGGILSCFFLPLRPLSTAWSGSDPLPSSFRMGLLRLELIERSTFS